MSSISTGTTSEENPSSGEKPMAGANGPRRSGLFRVLIAGVIFWMAVIFATSCTWIDRDLFVAWIWRYLPSAEARRGFASFWDGGGGLAVVKGYHMAEFGLLFLLARAVLSRAGVRPGTAAAIIAAGIAVVYAMSDEWHQTFVPGRGGTWIDVVIDTAGIGLAAMVSRKAWKRKGETIEAESSRRD